MLGLYLLLVSSFVQTTPQPLPELKPFLADFRKTLHTDELLLNQYTYSEKQTHIELDAADKPTSTNVDTYQITRGSDGTLYRRLVSKNGTDVKSAKAQKERRSSNREQDERIMDDLFDGYDIRILGRDDLNGRPAIRIRFTPREQYKPKTREGRLMRHVAGQAWVDESDHQLARVDAEVIDTMAIGFGLLAKVQKGARLYAERQKVNDEVWLPFRSEVTATARILLLKGFHVREVREYSDYKKFNVETIIKVE
jgi:hypothetical protein